jgi:glutathione S-transferase
MTDILLFMAPGTCARVTAVALEEVGLQFETQNVRFMKGEHKSPEFKRFNPKGKVPTLVIDGEVLTENIAIITYLDKRYPDAKLMPPTDDEWVRAQHLADLCFCGTTLHPNVSRIRVPQVLVSEPSAAVYVYEKGIETMREYFQLVEDRLVDGPWWYGDTWSMMDAYLFWAFWRVEGAEFDVGPYPRFTAHARRIEERPSMQRAMAREAEAQQQLEAEGLAFVPSVPKRADA